MSQHQETPPPQPESDTPVVADVRAIRERVSRQFGNDVRRLGQHLAEVQEKFSRSHPVVDRSGGESQRRVQ